MSRWLPLVALVVLVFASAGSSRPPAGPVVTHGVVVGDVSAGSAVLWARADREATLQVRLSGGAHRAIEPVSVRAGDDFTGRVRLDGLRPGRLYDYRVWFRSGDRNGPVVVGSFWTPPGEDETAPVRLAFGGDLAGQNVCRDAAEGFPILDTIRSWKPNVFVGLGDMIYADNGCDPTGRYGNAQIGRASCRERVFVGV